jgi:hypothetical protein
VTAPIKPERPSLELTLAQQANDAMAAGVDPRAATEMLGKMLAHLKQNPALADHGAEALANGIDPHAISAKLWEMTNATPAAPGEQAPLLVRSGRMLRDAAREIVEHPSSLITTPIRAAMTTFSPGVGEARPDPRLSKGGNPTVPIGGRFAFGNQPVGYRTAPIARVAYDAEHGGVTDAQRRAAGLATLGNVALPAIATGISRPLAQSGVNRLLANSLGGTTGAAVLGAASNPDDPFAGAVAGGATGALLTGVAPGTFALTRRLGSGAVDMFGVRPSGLTAQEMAADAAAMRAPVGPQAEASNTPTMRAMAENTPAAGGRGSVLSPRMPNAPTPLQRLRSTTGRAVLGGTPIESAKTVALRELARRFGDDAVTRADALAYAERAGTKPVAVLDLGGGNVAGLARTAKETPGLARRQIPEFLQQRSAGTPGAEGATLERITRDVENRLGLPPENYFQTADQMAQQQKALSKPAYDAVRHEIVDDPEVLSLFDIPEFRFAHKAVAQAERIRPNGAKIPPLSGTAEVGGETIRAQNAQSLGTLDKMRQYIGDVARGKLESKRIDRNTAGAMLERLDAVTERLDALYPEYADARAGYSGRARMMDAHVAGKEDFLSLDPRELRAKIDALPEGEADMYRRGAYDALRSRLVKMKDGANIGQWLEDNPDVRDRVAALAKNPDDAASLRSDLGIERAMGQRKNAILGGPNTAERLIEFEATKPRLTVAGDALRTIPVVGKLAGGAVDNVLTRRATGQTGAVMGEVGKILTRTGRGGIAQTFDELAALEAADLKRRLLGEAIAREFAAASAQSTARPRR